MRRHVVCTRLRVNLTRPRVDLTLLRVNLTSPRVDLTLLRVHLTRRHVRLELVPEALPPCPPTSIRPVLNRCSMDFIVAFFISFVFVLLFFCIFVRFLWAFISLM
jgi:hypothetical protein